MLFFLSFKYISLVRELYSKIIWSTFSVWLRYQFAMQLSSLVYIIHVGNTFSVLQTSIHKYAYISIKFYLKRYTRNCYSGWLCEKGLGVRLSFFNFITSIPFKFLTILIPSWVFYKVLTDYLKGRIVFMYSSLYFALFSK